MSRAEFMRQLEKLLQDIPEQERLDAMAYYNDYFDEAGEENEEQVLRELGSPEQVAANIKEDLGIEPEKEEKKPESEVPQYEPQVEVKEKKEQKTPWLLIIILLILASPVILGISGGVLGGLVAVVAAICGIAIAIIIGSIVCIVVGLLLFFLGIIRAFFSPIEAIATIGVGSLLVAIGTIGLVLFVWCIFKWIPALIKGIAKLVRKIFHKEKKGA